MQESMMDRKGKLLFGGELGWDVNDWTASDDRVRGGKSESHLTCTASTARFYGHLDITTLGGAGFASQRTTGEDREWNLAAYDGIELSITEADAKQYTFILRDELLPPDPSTAREQSTISYEYDFSVAGEKGEGKDATVRIAWNDFKATYRGKERKDAPSLNLQKIKRMSLMMRSFFGTQEGDFSLTIASISATAPDKSTSAITDVDNYNGDQKTSTSSSSANGDHGLKEEADTAQDTQDTSFLSWLVRKCWKL